MKRLFSRITLRLHFSSASSLINFIQISIYSALILLCSSSNVRAYIPSHLVGRQIVQVEVVGETATAISFREVGIPIGAPLTRPLIRKVIRRLVQTGKWANVQIDATVIERGVKLTIYLTPHIIISQIEIVGNRELEEQELLASLNVNLGSDASKQDLEILADQIRKSYSKNGYLSTKVDILLQDTKEPSNKVLLVRIYEGPPTRIAEINFSGEQPQNLERVTSAMDLDIGDILNRETIEEDVGKAEKSLRHQGYYEAELGNPLISIEQNSATVTIPSQIGPHYRVAIESPQPLKSSTVYDVLELSEEALSNPAACERIAVRVRDLYIRYGFYDAAVSVQKVPSKKRNHSMLRVRIQPGKQLKVVAISFAGAQFFKGAFLRDQLYSYLDEDLPGSSFIDPVDSKVVDDINAGYTKIPGRTVPPPPFVEPKSIYYPPTYQEAVKHIVELYQAEGFLSAQVGPITMQRLSKRRAVVSIPVIEGPRTLLHRVTMSGNEALSSRELLTEGLLEQNMPFSYLRLEEARLRMVKLYQEQGYQFVKIEPLVRFSQDQTRAEVSIQFIERFPVSIDNIVIRGAVRTSKSLIYDLIKFQPGDLYRPSVARESEEALLALGIFSGVKIVPQDPELPERVKTLVVIVTERPSQHIDFFAGVSTGQGLRGGFEYGYRNLFGLALETSLRVQLAYQLFILADDKLQKIYSERLNTLDKKLERRITLGTTIPHIQGLSELHTSIDFIHLRNNERDFGLDEYAVALTFRYPLSKRLMLSIGGNLELNTLELFTELDSLNSSLAGNPDAPRLRKLLLIPPGGSTLVAGHTTLSYDERDNPFVPTQGFFTSVTTEVAGTLGTQEIDLLDTQSAPDKYVSRFLKMTFGISGYLPLGAGVVIASQLRLGRIMHLFPPPGDTKPYTYPNRAFFMGGVDTIRGYFQDDMVPQDTADEIVKQNRIARKNNTEEIHPDSIMHAGDAFILLRHEVRFPIIGLLNGGIFTDLGNLWADPALIKVTKLVRPSVGAGIRLATPVGPLALDYGVLLMRRKESLEEPFGTLHFSIGLF